MRIRTVFACSFLAIGCLLAACDREEGPRPAGEAFPGDSPEGMPNIPADWAGRHSSNFSSTHLSTADVESLGRGVCPFSGKPLVQIDLKATGQYSDVACAAYYSPVEGYYWVRHEQGGLTGNVVEWWGPFVPGQSRR